MTRTAILLATASILVTAPQARAQDFLFGGQGPVPQGQKVQRSEGVTQIRMPNGSVVSFVGPAEFTLNGDTLAVDRGGVTIAGSAGSPVTLTLPGGGSARVGGAASLTVSGTGVTGNVLGGTIDFGGQRFSAGQAWAAAPGASPRRVFANAAQASPGAVLSQRSGGVVAAALNGVPVSLGEALGVVGAQGDIVAAATRLDAYAGNPSLGTFPSGDAALLIAYADRLARALGDDSFEGAGSPLIALYLGYLSEGGDAATFQSAYSALLVQYFQLLTNGGATNDFPGLNADAIRIYLAYLQSSGALGQLGAGQAPVVQAYLDFLANGGAPTDFIVPGALLTDAAIADYVAAISAYADFLAGGGVPANYAGVAPDVIARYLSALYASGLLDTLFGARAMVLAEYLAFVQAGGDPGAFDGFGDGTPPPPGPFVFPVPSGIEASDQFYNVQGGDFLNPDASVFTVDKQPATVIYDTVTGAPIYLEYAGVVRFGLHDAELLDGGSATRDGSTIAWGRWANGNQAGQLAGDPFEAALGALGQHVVAGDIAVDLPTQGTIQYDLIGNTTPTFTGLGLGTLDRAVAAVSFGSAPRFGFDFAVSSGATNYAVMTPGGIAGTATGGLAITDGRFSGSAFSDDANPSILISGSDCDAGCIANVRGHLAGAGAVFAGLTYQIGRTLRPVTGAIVFGQGDAITPPTDPVVDQIENQFIAYVGNGSAHSTIDQRAPAKVGYDPDTGAPISYFWSDNENLALGEASLVDTGSAGSGDSSIGWGRWVNGATTGNYYGSAPVLDAIGEHFIAGDVATNLPASGTIAYALLGGTSPTRNNGAIGTLDSGSMVVAFGAETRVGLELGFSMEGAAYTIQTSGGLGNFAAKGMTLGTNGFFFGSNGGGQLEGSGSGPLCTADGCNITVRGYLSGEAGANAGLVYAMGTGSDRAVGSAAFGATGAYTPPDTGPDGTTLSNQFGLFTGPQHGIDNRRPLDVTYDDATGAPVATVWQLNDYTREHEAPTIGSNDQYESGGVAGIIGWTRWAGGTTGGVNPGPSEFPINSGEHIVTGTPATNLPASGTVEYALIGSTQPTIRDGSLDPGTFSGRLAVAFGAVPHVGFEFDVSIGGHAYAINSPGGIADPMQGAAVDVSGDERFNMLWALPQTPVIGDGPVCQGDRACVANVQGFLAGDGASHVGAVYTFGAGTGSGPGYVGGVAAFGRNP
ncbi:MAG: hypothetical protein ACOH1E_03775 [Brevundimonas sp.]